ncbi:MAG TPA: hypothetical protein VF133_07575 [Terriglobales bacterium]
MASNYAFWRYLLWPQLAGVVYLIAGLVVVRRRLSHRLFALSVLGRVFVPAALATFAAEHFASANFIKDGVPPWMPGHLFWAYFVGCALLAAATSILAMKYVRLSATLLGIMLCLFVILLHIPNVVQHPSDRFAWAVAARDFGFAMGAWTLAASQFAEHGMDVGHRIMAFCRRSFALVLVFFAIEHLLHPQFTPGVPLPQQMPQWIPARSTWGYAMGVMLLASGISLLLDKYARPTTTCLGLCVTLVVLFINTPMLEIAVQPADVTTGFNYVGDTLLFAGMIFFVAEAVPVRRAAIALVEEAA